MNSKVRYASITCRDSQNASDMIEPTGLDGDSLMWISLQREGLERVGMLGVGLRRVVLREVCMLKTGLLVIGLLIGLLRTV